MYVTSKLNVGPIVLLKYKPIIFLHYNISIEYVWFGICQQQFEIRYWIAFKFCMHV